MSELLKIDNVTMQFSGLAALKDVNISVQEKEIYGVIGPNGAGKTTLYNVITGFNNPTKGKIIFDGQELNGKTVNVINQLGIARTFQNIRVFPDMTVLENVLIGMHNYIDTSLTSIILRMGKFKQEEEKAKAGAMEILKYMEIDQFADEFASNLSYGVQRKLEIARALSSEPKILMLDEPSAGMNDKETMALMDTIKKINREKNITIIVIEHNMEFIMNLCDTIAVLNFGELMMVGKPEEVQNDPRVIEAYIGRSDD